MKSSKPVRMSCFWRALCAEVSDLPSKAEHQPTRSPSWHVLPFGYIRSTTVNDQVCCTPFPFDLGNITPHHYDISEASKAGGCSRKEFACENLYGQSPLWPSHEYISPEFLVLGLPQRHIRRNSCTNLDHSHNTTPGSH
jgi:hypothetical protein